VVQVLNQRDDLRTMGELRPKSIAVVLGTRPEIIKLGHLIRLLGPAARVIHTGQHYDPTLTDIFFEAFGIDTASELVGVGGKTRADQIGQALTSLDHAFLDDHPDAVVVQGDTNSTVAAALAANAREIPLIHVEAGLRSFDRRMPEEHNRVVTDHLADLCLAPTPTASENLAAEGIPGCRIMVTGNTIVEAVNTLLPSPGIRREILERHHLAPARYVLSTFHRPENVDDPTTFARIFDELARLPLPVLLPLHPRSKAHLTEFGIRPSDQIRIIEPIGYTEFLGLLAECAVAVSDSGGIQEEASIVKRPILVVRRSTERPEVIGTFARLVSTDQSMVDEADDWLLNPEEIHKGLSKFDTPFGDGTASSRSIEALTDLIESNK
jgi:UDP-N-acetylglucosamine 2-epimerase (non-hydrolysing)